MANGTENTSQLENTGANNEGVPTVSSGQQISASQFQTMLSVLANLVNHTHTYTDTWTDNCNCNCTCACNRGQL